MRRIATRKIFAVLMALAMILQIFPVSAFAEDGMKSVDSDQDIPVEKYQQDGNLLIEDEAFRKSASATVTVYPVISGVVQDAVSIPTGSLVNSPLSGEDYAELTYLYATIGVNSTDINVITEVNVYDGVVYVREKNATVSGMKLAEGKKIYLQYTSDKQLNVEYAINPETAADGEYGVKLVGPNTVFNSKGLEFTLDLGHRYEATSIVVMSGSTQIKKITDNLTSKTYSLSASELSRASGSITITANVSLKTSYKVSFGDVSNAAVSTNANSWTYSAYVNGNNINTAIFTANTTPSSYSFYLHGTNYWSSKKKELSYISVVSLGGVTYNTKLAVDGTTEIANGVTVKVTKGASTTIHSNSNHGDCTTPVYTITINNCYEDIVFNANFKDTDTVETWIEEMINIQSVYCSKNGKTYTSLPNDKISGDNKNDITLTVKPADGYYLSASSDAYSAEVYQLNGSAIPTSRWTWSVNSRTGDGTLTLKEKDVSTYTNWGVKLQAFPYVYQVEYHMDGGSPAVSDDNPYDITRTIIIPGTIPKKDGYVFTGWKIGNNKVLEPGASIAVKNLTSDMYSETGKTRTVTLTAQWEKEESHNPNKPIYYNISVSIIDADNNVIGELVVESAYPGVPVMIFEEALRDKLEEMAGMDLSEYDFAPNSPFYHESITSGQIVPITMNQRTYPYTVEYYNQKDDGSYPETATRSDTSRKAAKGKTVAVTAADKNPPTGYTLDDAATGKVYETVITGSGDTLKVYFKKLEASYTIHHYLYGTTTKVADDVTGTKNIGETLTATDATGEDLYDGYKTAAASGYDPAQSITISATAANTIIVYYKLPMTIAATTASKPYDGTPLNGAYTVTGALASDKAGIEEKLGTAPSITNVSESPKNYLTETEQAAITGIPGYYNVTYTSGTLTITKATSMTVVAVDYSGKYDGNVHEGGATPSVTTGTTVQYSVDGGQNWSDTVPSIKDFGTVNYTVKATNPNYEDATADGTLNITKRSVTLKSDDGSKPYDGTPLTKPTVTVSGDGFITGEATDIKATGSVTTVAEGEVTNTITYTEGTNFKAANYAISKTEGKLKIIKADTMTVVAVDYNGKYDGKTYTGGATPSVTAGTTVQYSVDGGQNWSDTVPSIKDFGTVNYTVKATNPNYEDATADGTLNVTKRSVTLKSEDGSKPYDGTPLTKPTVTVSGDGFVDGEVTDIKATGSVTTVDEGEVTNTITYTEGTNFKAANYDISKTEGTLKITAVTDKVTVTVTENSDEVTYDGGNHTVTGYTSMVSGNDLYDTATSVKATETDAWTVTETDAGTYDLGIVPDDFENINKNFANVEFVVVDGQLKINPIEDEYEIAVTGKSDTKTYNGGEQSVNGYTVSEYDATIAFTGIAQDDAKATAKGTDADTYTMAMTEADFSATSGNYTNIKITVNPGTLTIHPIEDKVTVTITGNSGEEMYDGTEKAVEGYTVSIDNELYTEDDFDFSGDAVATGTDAGSYDMELKAEDFANVSKNFTNVEFVIEDGTLEISKRAVTLTSADAEKVYDGTALTNDEITVGGDGFADGEGATCDVTGSQTLAGESENTFTYELNEGTKADNYEITTVFGTLTVTEAPQFRLTVNYWIGNMPAADSFTNVYDSGAEYNVASPVVLGYTPDQERVTGTITADTTVNVLYTVNAYELTVNYTFIDGSPAVPSYTAQVNYGDNFAVPTPELEGYTANVITYEGTMPARDVVYTVIYTANPAPEPAPEPEDDPTPDPDPAPNPEHVPFTILDDYDTPLGLPNVSMSAGEMYE